MSTRCTISREYSDGKIEARYSHSDGYPDWMGFILAREFTTMGEVDKIFEGERLISGIDQDGSIEWMSNPDDEPPMTYDDWQQFKDSGFYGGAEGMEYVYVFKENTNEWFYIDLNKESDELQLIRLTFPAPNQHREAS